MLQTCILERQVKNEEVTSVLSVAEVQVIDIPTSCLTERQMCIKDIKAII